MRGPRHYISKTPLENGLRGHLQRLLESKGLVATARELGVERGLICRAVAGTDLMAGSRLTLALKLARLGVQEDAARGNA